MTDKKRNRGDVNYNVIVDSEDGELLDFFWDEDHEPPPLIKPRKDIFLFNIPYCFFLNVKEV